jgi:RecG-like helicase/REP element-mobilizing transposase RayT
MLEPSQLLSELDWIPRPRLLALRRLGLETVENLITHFPRRHEDRREFARFPREESDQAICLCGEVIKTQLRRFGGWKKIFEATLQETDANALSQPLVCRWFNLHYIQKMIATGQRLVVFGKPKLRGRRICMDHPEFEIIEDDEESSLHFRRITPIYPATEGLSQRVVRALIYRALEEISDDSMEVILPGELESDPQLDALRQIHFPASAETLAAARQQLVLAEFFAMQMLIGSRRSESLQRSGQAHCGTGELLEKFLRSLPFDLTNAQERVITELRRDLGSQRPMNRLLQGDVGSGKTVAAIAAMLLAVEGGFQAALMAPTQILAEQHYAVLCRWLEPFGLRMALRTGDRRAESGMPLFDNPGSTGCQPVAPESFSGGSLASQTRYSKRNLPHFERPWTKYAVTFSTRQKRILSEGARDIVLDSLLHWNERRYTLYAACVMPDHVHILLEPAIKETDENGTVFFSLREIFHSVKAHTARAINRAEQTSGPVWEEEWFDRMIRSESDLQEKYDYITRNAFTAGLDTIGDYRWVWSPGKKPLDENGRRAVCPPQRADSPCSPERSDAPHVIIGTHALLYESVSFENLGLVVIDEQHKFGVAQRARLTSREPAPDVLVMTATPIPRTLTMTVYGDLDVSIIDEMPRDRGKIVTAVRDDSKLPEVLIFLRGQMEAGRQAYVIYPLIEESDKVDVKAAAAEYELWRERLRPFRCELLHGRIAAQEKQEIMERFRRGETSILVSTTVIEVGVDVPNATVMLVENAERFGLAQLHQLRGRIGRGQHKSYCILLSGDESEETRAKLTILEKTNNGFEVAEADWNLRGPGDLLGTAQSGLPALKLGNLVTDAPWMRRARCAAAKIFENDPYLDNVENQRFRRLVVEEQGRTFSHVS